MTGFGEESEGPSLLSLAASALAANPPAELKALQGPPLPPASATASASGELRLPLPASQALFDSYRRNPDEPIAPHQLQPFTDGQCFPLESLDLQDCYSLTDGQLCALLKAQRRSLRSLNINNCERLTHRLSGRLRCLRLPRLRLLCIGYSKHILGSWFQPPLHPPSSLFAHTDDHLDEIPAGSSLQLPTDMDTDDDADGAAGAQAQDALRAFVLDLVDEASSGDASLSHPMEVGEEGGEEDEEEEEDEEVETEEEKAGPSTSHHSHHHHHMEWELQWAKKPTAMMGMASPPGQRPAMAPPLTAICPNLQALICYGFSLDEHNEFSRSEFIPRLLRNLLAPLERLLYLDLSYWEGLDDARFLRPLSASLTALVLYSVPDLYRAVDTIAAMPLLATLDLSQPQKDSGIYPRPVTTLHKLVSSLPHLRHLDISGTNLASPPSKDDWPAILREGGGKSPSDIVGLRGLRRRLDFLGLYNCEGSARLTRLPAEAVCGDGSEAQVLLALQTYMDRQELLRDVLNEVYTVYRFGGADAREGVQQRRALGLVVKAMSGYLRDATTQIAGSASLFYIIKPVTMSGGERRAVVRTLLAGMEAHMEETVMVRNCCLSLCQVEIPADVLHDYERAARLLIHAIKAPAIDEMTQKVVVYLLNSMACHVEGEHKSAVGELGAVEAVLDQIRRRVEADNCDEVMEVAWSFLWNITDETPGNCERFLDKAGLQLFLAAYHKFPQQKELVRNMMGLMGNIAEVAEQRPCLRRPEYIRIFVELLECLVEGIEISYNSAGVLAHILSDPEWMEAEAEAERSLSRESVSAAVIAATEKWKLDQRRFINYRSFGPILRLLRGEENSASLTWGVWALANLTTVDGHKYCEFVRREGGECLLANIVASPNLNDRVKSLAQIVRDNMAKWTRNELPTYSHHDADEL